MNKIKLFNFLLNFAFKNIERIVKYAVAWLCTSVHRFSPQPLNQFWCNLEYIFPIYKGRKLAKKIFQKLLRKKVIAWQPISYQYIKITLCIRQKKLLSVLDKKVTLCIRQNKWLCIRQKMTLCFKQTLSLLGRRKPSKDAGRRPAIQRFNKIELFYYLLQ